MLNEKDRYIVQTVLSDLHFLRDKWDQKIDDDSLRRSSNVLRGLLVEDNLGKAWRILGFDKQPRIEALNLIKYLVDIPFNRITFAHVGGATFQGMQISGALMVNFAMTDEQRTKRYEMGPFGAFSNFWLSDFVNSPCIVIKGLVITRSELIKYVANKLGGTHIDMSRDPANSTEQKFIALDAHYKEIGLANKNAIYFELLSIGQALMNSGDISKFMESAEREVKP